MESYKKEFIKFCLDNKVLLFGEFTLKSGRLSPYFFNAGLFNTGEALATLGGYYAKALSESRIAYDALFGPAYKGIPLVSATAIAMASMYDQPTPFAFNRKEAKDHGEGGILVGSDLKNKRVILVDDVISAGTAVRESMNILNSVNAQLAGIIISMDREEIGKESKLSAIQEIETTFNTKVISVISLSDLIVYLDSDEQYKPYLPAMMEYRKKYGAAL